MKYQYWVLDPSRRRARAARHSRGVDGSRSTGPRGRARPRSHRGPDRVLQIHHHAHVRAALVVLLIGGFGAALKVNYLNEPWIEISIAILVVTLVAMYALARPYFRKITASCGMRPSGVPSRERRGAARAGAQLPCARDLRDRDHRPRADRLPDGHEALGHLSRLPSGGRERTGRRSLDDGAIGREP